MARHLANVVRSFLRGQASQWKEVADQLAEAVSVWTVSQVREILKYDISSDAHQIKEFLLYRLLSPELVERIANSSDKREAFFYLNRTVQRSVAQFSIEKHEVASEDFGEDGRRTFLFLELSAPNVDQPEFWNLVPPDQTGFLFNKEKLEELIKQVLSEAGVVP